MSSHFDFVCLNCRRMNKYDLELLSPDRSFQCPYCKSTFSVVNNKITMTAVGRTVRPPQVHQAPAHDYNSFGGLYS